MEDAGKVGGSTRLSCSVALFDVQDQHEPGPVALWWEALMLYVPLNILGFLLLPMTPFQRRFQVRWGA